MDTSLPRWWNIPFTGALNAGYPYLMGGRVGNFVRLRLRLQLGTKEPDPADINDPKGGLRLHTAWDVAYQTPFGGNHVDVPCQLRQANPGGVWDLIGHLDVPIDVKDPAEFTKNHCRLVNSWAEFEAFPGVEKVNLAAIQVWSGNRSNFGIQREDLPEMPGEHKTHH